MNHASIPNTEFISRWRNVQELMKKKSIDLLFAYGDDRAVFGPAHVRWLADIPVHFEPLCVMLLPHGDPILLSGPESNQYALLRGKIKDVRVLEEFTHPDEEYPYSIIQSLDNILTNLGWERAHIHRAGIGGLQLINYGTLQTLKNALPDVEWIDLEADLVSLRAVKTPAEIAIIRRAYQIADAGIAAAVEVVAPGKTERSVAAAAEAVMRSAGAEGFGIDTIVASGPNARPILARSTFREIQKNDHVLLTLAPRYEGYHSAVGRMVFVGEPNPQIEQAYRTAVKAQEACGSRMQAGELGSMVEAAGRDITASEGYGEYFLYSGLHSVGVIEFEPPIFGPGTPGILEENMVMSVDIPLFNTPWGGLRVEDGYLVTQSGAKKLSQSEYYFYR